MSERTANGDEDRIKDVAGERNPRGVHQHEQVAEVGQRGVFRKESRRIHPKLIQRLERLHDYVHHRQHHECAQECEHESDSCVASRGTGQDNLMFSGS